MQHQFARQLRKNMTEEERLLWRELRYRQIEGCKFRRQAPVGNYIVDFICFEAKLIVELDGGQHATQIGDDSRRTEWLQSQGFRVVRFWNHQVREELETVMDFILKNLRPTPHPAPPPQGGREKTGHSQTDC